MAPTVETELKCQLKMFNHIKNFLINSINKVAPEKRTAFHFETRLKLLDDYWSSFFKRNETLEVHSDDVKFKEEEYFANDLFSEAEMLYVSHRATLMSEWEKLKVPLPGDNDVTPGQQGSNENVLLAQSLSHSVRKVNIPKFSGEQHDWEHFKEMFEAVIINDHRIAPIVKLEHLINNCEGKAKPVLKGVRITSANFKLAWDKLLRRYDGRKRRLHTHLQSFLDLPQVQFNLASDISILIDRAEEAVKGLEGLQCPIDSYNNWFVYLVVRKLDPETRDSWNLHEEKKEEFSLYTDLLNFLENRVASLMDTPELPQPEASVEQSSNKKGTKSVKAHLAQETTTSKDVCIFCAGTNHRVYRCFQFLKLNVNKRIEFMNKNKRCLNCFTAGHNTSKCNSKMRCLVGGCGLKHNSLVHIDGKQSTRCQKTIVETNNNASCTQPSTSNLEQVTQTHCSFSNQAVLLATAQIILKNDHGHSLTVNALIDHGSMRSFISKRVLFALNLTSYPTSVTVKGIGNSELASPSEFCRLTLSSRANRNLNLPFNALILGQLTSKLPNREVVRSQWPHIQNLNLADPDFTKPKSIDCILGAEVYAQIVMPGIKQGPVGTPLAQQTVLGWILTGLTSPSPADCLTSHVGICIESFLASDSTRLADTLAQLWETDKIPQQKFMTKEEQECEKHYCSTVYRVDGRYGVRLPFKVAPTFPGSKAIAIAAWTRSQKRFGKNPELKLAYDKFMLEYLNLGHMEEIPVTELDRKEVYYIPHHPVFHQNKIRVVFNASAPALNGISLNDTLYTGEKLQQDLVLVLIKWRFFPVVFTCDMVKMYRQILMHPEDRDWLRIVYDFGQGLQFFRLGTVTYGTTPAPFQALRTMKQIRLEYKLSPTMLMMLQELSYIDDFFGGADSLHQALQLRQELIDTLKLAKIDLSKWSSNHTKLLEGVHSDQSDKPLELPNQTNTLGMTWSPSSDSFSYRMQPFQSRAPITKRKVLSDSSRLFDPLGWICPILIQLRIFMQDLWLDGLDWDTPLSNVLHHTWLDLKAQVEGIDTIRIPRWLGSNADTNWILHGFADASKRAFAACVYFVPIEGTPRLIAAKAKVAPIKTLSITKLELSACHLLAKLIDYVLPSFSTKPQAIHCWSDARNVLCLLKLSPARLKVFEANRVSEILSLLPQVRWLYVPTDHNPADCATRGLSATILSNFVLWWSGPSWIAHEEMWPAQLDLQPSEPMVSTAVATTIEPPHLLTLVSSFSHLVRLVARMRRWLNYKKSYPKPSMTLTSAELRLAEETIIRMDQNTYFSHEIKLLEHKLFIPKRSKLAPLNPFLDDHNLLRVGSRLVNCPYLTYQEKFPIILDRQSLVARMIVRDYHHIGLHSGPQLTLSLVARQFYIICSKRVVKSVLSKCVKCVRYSGRVGGQQMAALPRERTDFKYPFASTGLDYAGPFKVRPSKGRGIASLKGYLCVFVCFVTRAVHLEIVSDLTTKAFLAAFERFSNRRGLPTRVYSDNGSTLQGAEREIQQLFDPSSSYFKKVHEFVNTKGVDWSFSPPYGPHFGGIWEAAVKAFKHHFKRVVGDSALTYELSTLATQIEGCLNSRPLCALSSDSRDPVPLTPNHFLIGRPIQTLPPSSEASDLTKTYNQRWMRILAMRNSFWGTWKKEVLHQLTQRNKWYFPQRNLKVGDIVLLKEENSPPAVWPLGRVSEVHPNRSGLVRVATVDTAKSSYIRPVHKLIFLPIDDEAIAGYHARLAVLE